MEQVFCITLTQDVPDFGNITKVLESHSCPLGSEVTLQSCCCYIAAGGTGYLLVTFAHGDQVSGD